jgi:DNA-binding response OmpR family regulator
MNKKPKILLIEDDEDLVAAMRIMLEKKGYSTLAAFNPDEGRKFLDTEKPDLIILDVMFGSKGESKGFDFAQKIRIDKQHAGIPILMLTAINSQKPFFNFSPDTDGEYLPVDDFLDKPVKADILLHKVEELLARKTSKWNNWPEVNK